jgi:hypothetical protein
VKEPAEQELIKASAARRKRNKRGSSSKNTAIIIQALNHLKIKYFTLFAGKSGTAIIKRFLTVVANRPALTISVAEMSEPAFFTETM